MNSLVVILFIVIFIVICLFLVFWSYDKGKQVMEHTYWDIIIGWDVKDFKHMKKIYMERRRKLKEKQL